MGLGRASPFTIPLHPRGDLVAPALAGARGRSGWKLFRSGRRRAAVLALPGTLRCRRFKISQAHWRFFHNEFIPRTQLHLGVGSEVSILRIVLLGTGRI